MNSQCHPLQLFTQEHLNEIKTLDSTLELERNPHTPIQTHIQPTATLYYEDRRGLGEDLAWWDDSQ